MSTDSPEPPSALKSARNPTTKIIRQKIWRRMHVQNEHFMGAFVGREGFAKSHTALKVASVLDPSFDADRVFFDPQQFLEAFGDNDTSKGNIIVFDEAGVGLGNRSWYEKEQILTNQVLQTVRDENMGVLFTLPRLEELDKQTIGRLHGFFEMVAKHSDTDPPYAEAKYKNVSLTRDGRDAEYKKYPRLRVGGVEQRVKRLAFTPPDDELVAAYEERKESFKEELYADAIDAYDDEENKKRDPKDVADEIVENDRVAEFKSVHPQNKSEFIDKDLIRSEFDLSVRDAKTVSKLIEKAGESGL